MNAETRKKSRDFGLSEPRRQRLEARRADLMKRATQAGMILGSMGAEEVWLFGSLAKGRWYEHSDVDMAVLGMPKEWYGVLFEIFGSEIFGVVELEDAHPVLLERIRKEGIKLWPTRAGGSTSR